MFRRVLYVVIGIGFVVFGTVGEDAHRTALPPSRRLVIIAGGLFFVYIGSMYYLPKNRRKRESLRRLLEEAEKEDRINQQSD